MSSVFWTRIRQLMRATNSKRKQSQEMSNKERMQRLLREMECLICMEYMTADIYQCQNSHNVCGFCNSKIKNCPCCSLPMIMRNRALEKMAMELSYPCKYPGCDGVYPMDELDVHHSECAFGRFTCPLTCSFKGLLDELLVHFVIRHENVFSDAPTGQPFVNTLLDVRPQSCWDQLLMSVGSVFFCSFIYSKENFYGYVKHVGPLSSDTYVYEISLIGADEKSTFTMKNEVHRFSDMESDIIKSSSCLKIGKDMLQKYLDSRKRLKTTIMLQVIVQPQKDDTEKSKNLGATSKVKSTVKPKKSTRGKKSRGK